MLISVKEPPYNFIIRPDKLFVKNVFSIPRNFHSLLYLWNLYSPTNKYSSKTTEFDMIDDYLLIYDNSCRTFIKEIVNVATN